MPDVKDRLLKANHNVENAGVTVAADVKDRLLKANHNNGSVLSTQGVDVKDRLLKANHNLEDAGRIKTNSMSKIVC